MNPDALPVTARSDTVERIEREKLRLAFGTWVQYVDGIPFALGLTAIMCGLLPSVGATNVWIGVAWFAVALAWAATASLAFAHYGRREASCSPKFWRIWLAAIWMAHAAIWGASVWVFWQENNAVNQAILCTIALGVLVSYFFSLSMYFPVLVAALTTLAAAQWSAFIVYGGALSHVFMIAFPMFVGVLVNYGLGAARRYHVALQLRFENEALAAALARANQAKSDFLASMSHELRTPLNAVIGYSDLMRQRTFGPIAPARYAGYIDDIHSSGEHLLRMINDLLDLAKIEAGKRDLNFVPVNLGTIAAEAVKLVEPQAASANVGLLNDMKYDVFLKADARAVKQMIVNLLSNAVKYSRPGGIAVVFCEVLPGNRVACGVRDTGIGMSPEMLSKAVEPFAQAATDAYTVEGRGTGLGLPIVKALMDAHQGDLRLESTLGIGSRVWLEFPAERLLRRNERQDRMAV